MDPNYKPPSSLDVAKLPPRKPSPRGGMETNVPTTSGQSPCSPHYYLLLKQSWHTFLNFEFSFKDFSRLIL